MLDAETKRRIDTARDILVGKVPDPKSQVEQITIALIYKFMDDMDAESEELGGRRTFFADGFAKYGWAKLMSPGIGGHETLNLYAEAVTKMPENPGIPPLFRDIFNNAYLPYRDPETLRSFLKVIDGFSYDHSERLGDAFEYLLSVLGAQGDAGQFRTPRHIIDFMVSVIDPKKDEVVLDPACGTAGFLISSYKHILASNTGEDGSSTLTPDDRARLASNFKGYDISPDMVRLSLVNMYLHGFVAPQILEYDTLTSDERWNEYADVILANPPFMSPKGGIRPHNRFSIQSKRSEVLFVDYIAEHLNPAGRAGVIVPEGIIFQSQNAHKRLRKMLLETCLVAVVSLPAGVFKPYSGVKTSILILDKSLARRTDSVAFFKVENDGFDLGDQRKPIEANDLPQTARAIREYLDAVQSAEGAELREERSAYVAGPGEHGMTDLQILTERGAALSAAKAKITADGECNLSGERYKDNPEKVTEYPYVAIRKVTDFFNDGNWIESRDQSNSGIRLIQTGNIGIGEYLDKPQKARFINEDTFSRLGCTEVFSGDVLVSRLPDPVGRACIVPNRSVKQITAVDCSIIRFDRAVFLPELFVALTKSSQYFKNIEGYLTGATRPRISRSNLGKVRIPLPPLPVQKEIVAEIEGYQKVIDGARAVVDNYRPHISVNPDWPLVTVNELTRPQYGFTASAQDQGDTRFIRITDISERGTLSSSEPKFINATSECENLLLARGDILLARTGATYGKTLLFNEVYPAVFASYLIRLRFPPEMVDPYYYWIFAQSDNYWNQAKILVTGGGQPQFNGNAVKQIKLPLPPLTTQHAIVAEIESEQELVNANRELIARFEKKSQGVIDRVWGASSSDQPSSPSP